MGHFLPDYKIAIEINGMQFHSALTPWIRDHWKNNEAVLRGWRTLRCHQLSGTTAEP